MSLVQRRGALLRRPAGRWPRRRGFWFSRYLLGAVGKWETCFLFSTFPSARVAGAVEMWESRRLWARFPRGSWKEWEACLWLSTLSTAPAFPQLTPAWLRAVRGYPLAST